VDRGAGLNGRGRHILAGHLDNEMEGVMERKRDFHQNRRRLWTPVAEFVSAALFYLDILPSGGLFPGVGKTFSEGDTRNWIFFVKDGATAATTAGGAGGRGSRVISSRGWQSCDCGRRKENRSFRSSLANAREGVVTSRGVYGARLWGDVTWN
jgi:hypothetical protein